MDNSTVRAPRGAVLLHWALAAALVAQLALGWWMLGLPKTPPGLRAGWFNVHKSIGLCIGIVVLLRLLWRLRVGPAAWRAPLPAWQQRAAGTAHALLYLSMVLLPLSGYLGSVFSGYPVRFFGVVLPAWTGAWPEGKQFMSALHAAVVWLLMAVAVVHVAAALWHWWLRDGVAERMGLPALRRRSAG